MPLLLVQGSSAIHPLPFIVLSRFYRPYLTSAGSLLFSLRAQGWRSIFKSWHFRCLCRMTLNAVFSGSAGCLKISLILVHVSVGELKKLSVCSVHKAYEVLKMNSPCWGNPLELDLVWKSLGLANPIQTHLWWPQLMGLFLRLLISVLSGIRFQKKESNFSLTL